ncbi:MAG: transcription termination factor NusA [Candidatus Omnitrophota bacterium]|nr:transcription termination factor NusA [Candidatus Omnitrophota bacterium]
MSQELLAIIGQIEREKGIKKEVLIEAVESALSSAARKTFDIKPDEKLRVELDPVTGKITAFKNEEELTSLEFGRIAASTARQVIIQKIREAEKDVIFNEFQGKAGEITSGAVYRFEKGNIIVDLLGRTEGMLPKSEQSSREEFKQGQRIRAYILEVKRESKGPQIILSRAHSSFVKKLFELEVPEIYEGIVEIKAISRQAGERTKIAVLSKNERVDPVGACVGMRGNRVRNIVNELQGEKIDIVPFNEDIKEYIKHALSLKEVVEIKLNKDRLRAEVIVVQDQLSVAIGKQGQNVRLASKLIGWELDIRPKEVLSPELKEEAQEKEAVGEEKEVIVEEAGKKEKKTALENLPGAGEKTCLSLREAGFDSIESLAETKIDDLIAIKGIAKKKAEKLIEEAKRLLKG